MYKLLALLTLLISQSVWSGGVNSGGGYVVACTEEGKTKYEFLDFYEAKEMIKGFEIKELPSGTDEFEVAKAVIDRIKNFNPQFAKEWKETVEKFKNGDTKFVRNSLISDINDAETIIIPNGPCRKQQAAVQLKTPANNQYRLYIDQNIWQNMDMLNKVGLIVHEAIYKMAMVQGHVKSNLFRPINALLFSKGLETLTNAQLAILFKEADLEGCFINNYEYSDEKGNTTKFQVELGIDSLQFDDEAKHITGVACESKTITNIFNEGDLEFSNGTIFEISPERVCIEDGKSYSRHPVNTFTFYKTDGNDIQPMYEKVCLGGPFTNKLISAKSSSLKPKLFAINALSLDSCQDQTFFNGEISYCRASGKIKIQENQVLPVRGFNSFKMLDEKGIEIELKIFGLAARENHISIGGKPFEIAHALVTEEDTNFHFSNIDDDQIVTINNTICRLHASDRIYFDRTGNFTKVEIGRFTETVIQPDSCIKLVNKK